MKKMATLVRVILFACLMMIIHSEKCVIEYGSSGIIEDHIKHQITENCWIIQVPKNLYVSVDVAELRMYSGEGECGLKIIEIETGVNYIFDSRNKAHKVTSRSSLKIIHYSRNAYYSYWSKLTVNYETSQSPKELAAEALKTGVSWLKRHRTPSYGWQEETPRAVVALFLASAVNFDGTDLEEELIAKQLELKTSLVSMRSSLSTSELSVFVNALLVTCHNPRHFYGKNLVKRLKTQVETTQNYTHPIAYLALCNANESWPEKAWDDLNHVLSTNSDYPFVQDIQAIAVLALSCMERININVMDGSNTSALLNDTIQHFYSLQYEDGSFGNTHTTAWIVQALLSRNVVENNEEWDFIPAVDFLMDELKSPSVDFLSVYLILPILKAKTLADISKIDCSASTRKHFDDVVSQNMYHLGSKVRIKYSLYIGDQKDVTHTTSLRIPRNFTAYDVMKLAETEDPKYKFEEILLSGKRYVYKMASTTNDPENGRFWMPYISSLNNTAELKSFSTELNKLIVNNGQHLVMWYKTVNI